MENVPAPRDQTPVLRALLLLVPVLLVLNGGVFYQHIRCADRIEARIQKKRELVLTVARLLFRLKDTELLQRDFLLSNRDDDLQSFQRSGMRLRQSVAELHRAGRSDPGLAVKVREIDGELIGMINQLDENARLRRVVGFRAGNQNLFAMRRDATATHLRSLIADLYQAETDALDDRESEGRANRRILVASILGLTALAVLLLALIFHLWRRDRENRERTARSLRESEERTMAVLNNSPVILWAVDAAGFCTMAEGSGLTGIECPPSSFVGRNIFESFWDRPDLLNPAREALQGLCSRTEICHNDHWYQVTQTPVFDGHWVSGTVGVAVDVTERRLRERETQMANEAKSQFLANMSHEIRTPLGLIMGFVDLTSSSETTPEDRPKYLAKVRHNAEVLSRLVDDILDLSKVEAGKLDVESIDFSLGSLLADIAENFRPKAEQKGIRLEVEAEPGLRDGLRADPVRLRQILVNLVGNAIKFTQHGFVRLHVSGTATAAGCELRLTVQDSGIGLSEESRKRLFNPFSQAESSTARRFGGTGLGLMLSRKLAGLMQGELVLRESAPGKGCTFEVRLPMQYASVSFAGGPNEVTNPARPIANRGGGAGGAETMRSKRLEGLRILMVDDAIDNQMLVKILLQMNGADVMCAGDGAAGVELGLKGTFDLVLMDVQMPGMDGFEAMRSLREATFRKPIVALTAHAMRDEREHALRSGFDDYLTKPINRAELVNVVESRGRASLATFGRNPTTPSAREASAPPERSSPVP